MSTTPDPRPNPWRGQQRRPALLHTAEGIADYVGLPLTVARHLIRRGVLPTFRIGRTVYARPEQIDAALAELERQEIGKSTNE